MYNAKMHACPFCAGQSKSPTFNETPVCPRCGDELSEYTYRDTTLNICPKCSGLWLDVPEFNRLTSERDVYRDDSIPYEYARGPLPTDSGYN